MRFAALALALVGLFPIRPPGGPTFDEISETIRRLVDEQHLPSVVVGVAKDGRLLWEEGFGWADRVRRIRARPDTPYSLASISKPFTATAVMKLVESGRLVLDRPANAYLGEARISGRGADRATVRHLLSHMSGLPPFYRPLPDGQRVPVDDTIAKYALLTNPPGRRYVYSNLGYGILEGIIERVSGMSYEDFVEREIFLPLRMESASVPHAAPPDAAVRYDAHDRPLPFYDVAHRGASSVYASVRDLIRFGSAHLDGRVDDGDRVLTRRSIQEMQRIHAPDATRHGYGLGWRIDDRVAGFRRVGHTGGMPGVATVLSLYPAQRVVIVVLTNKRNDHAARLEQQIASALMPAYTWRARLTASN